MGLNFDEWCEFHHTHRHTMESCQILRKDIGARECNPPRPNLSGVPNGEQSRDRSWPKSQPEAPYQGTIATISGGSRSRVNSDHKEKVCLVSNDNTSRYHPKQRSPYFLLERRLQGHLQNTKLKEFSSTKKALLMYSARVLFGNWSCSNHDWKNAPSTLIGFSGKQVKIHGCVEIKTTFGMGKDAKTILVKYTIINVGTSYKTGRGSQRAIDNRIQVNFLDLNPYQGPKDQRPQAIEDLKEI
ncbi:hypothetical protein CR513_56287, partial [Mucuna pruriens]